MKIAVLADIHGNSSALVAVLDDMKRLGISDGVNLGDHFSGPLDAAGTAELLRAGNLHSIRGNHDRWLIEEEPSSMAPSDKAAYDQLTRSDLDWLKALPATRTVYDDIFMCHGTPDSDLTYWLERVEPDGSIRASTLQEIETHAGDVGASLILCGHTHIPRLVRLPDGRSILNPGSVGCPAYDDDAPVFHVMETGTPNASYAIVEKSTAGWLVTFRSVPYDASRMIGLAKAHGRETWAKALATGWLRR